MYNGIPLESLNHNISLGESPAIDDEMSHGSSTSLSWAAQISFAGTENGHTQKKNSNINKNSIRITKMGVHKIKFNPMNHNLCISVQLNVFALSHTKAIRCEWKKTLFYVQQHIGIPFYCVYVRYRHTLGRYFNSAKHFCLLDSLCSNIEPRARAVDHLSLLLLFGMAMEAIQ